MIQQPEQPCAILLQGSYTFGARTLFNDVELQLPTGQWTCLLGTSGIGKSTILRLLADLPAGGQFSGEIKMSDATPVPERVAYMAQADLLAPWLNVFDNVVLGARLRGEPVDIARANELIARVGLSADKNKRPGQLSGGMRQRAALARTLMEHCPLVLLDEPFSALDARTRADMQELAFELLSGSTVLLATHDPGEAARLAHQICILSADGLIHWPAPHTPPIRSPQDPATMESQAHLLATLRQQAPPPVQ